LSWVGRAAICSSRGLAHLSTVQNVDRLIF